MNLKKKTDFWVDNNLITKEQQKAILKKEDKGFLPFVLLSFLWMGILCFCVGLFSLVYVHWAVIPLMVKLTGFLFLIILLSGVVFYAFKGRKKTVLETALFFAFLMIGGGIGLFSQIFNLPLINHRGLLLWAFLSLGIVFVSKKEFLFLLWIPLFLGGILGFLRLELLLLFFEQAPLFSTIVLASFFFILLFLTRNATNHWIQGVYKWSILLYLIIVFLGDRAMSNIFMGVILLLFFLLLLMALAVKERRVNLFNIVSLCIVLRVGLLYFQLLDSMHITGIGFLLLGLFILFVCVLWILFEKRVSSKPIFPYK